MNPQKTEPKPDSEARGGRRDQVVRAALEVLGDRGSKGLTHRAVDEAAGVPPGTTTNSFPTREKLLSAALRRHVELDTPPSSALADLDDLELSDDQAKNLVLAALDRMLAPAARSLLAARFELVLESTRRPELHADFEPARERFINLIEALVEARGCGHPRDHAVQLAATLDGVLLDQLLGASSALDRDQIENLVERQLATC